METPPPPQTPTPPPPLPPELPQAVQVHILQGPGQRLTPVGGLLLSCAVALLAMACLSVTALVDPTLMGAIFAGLAMAGYWILSARMGLAWGAGHLGVLAALGLIRFPSLVVAWLVAAGVAGLVGAQLTRRRAEEDEFFFLPLGAAALTLGLLVAAGAGGGPAAVGAKFAAFCQVLQQGVQEQVRTNPAYASSQAEIQLILSHFKGWCLSLQAIVWALALWLGGRQARRLLGRLHTPRSSFLLFRIQQRFIFVLILALVLEIFSILTQRGALSYAAWPLFGVMAVGCFFAGLGVVLFQLMVRRLLGRPRGLLGPMALVVALALAFWQLVALLGLLDVWFDFRRLSRLRAQMEGGRPGGNPTNGNSTGLE